MRELGTLIACLFKNSFLFSVVCQVLSRCLAISEHALPNNSDPSKESAGIYDAWPFDRSPPLPITARHMNAPS